MCVCATRGPYKKKIMVAASTILQLTVTYTPSDPPSSTGFLCGARVFLLVTHINGVFAHYNSYKWSVRAL